MYLLRVLLQRQPVAYQVADREQSRTWLRLGSYDDPEGVQLAAECTSSRNG